MELRLPDPARRFDRVGVEGLGQDRACHWRDGDWRCDLGDPELWRFAYQFEVHGPGAQHRFLLDPLATHQVQTADGPRSEWRSPRYREPAWLSAPTLPGDVQDVALPSTLAHPLQVRVWSPPGLGPRDPAVLLWCHDGTAYEQRSDLTRWAGAHLAAGTLPPMRIVLADAPRRMQWYSASPRYLSSASMGLHALREQYAVTATAVMGASLGGLSALLIALRDPTVDAVLAQSGSFFRAGDEPAGWRWLPRVIAAAEAVRSGAWARRAPDLLIGMTCGSGEENLANNRDTAAALRAQGFAVEWDTVPDLHNDVCWRDSLDPIWPRLLQRCRTTPG